MKIREVFDVFKDMPEFDDRLESISYDGDDESFRLEFSFIDECVDDTPTMVCMHLFGDGSDSFGIMDSGTDDSYNEFIDVKVAKFVAEVDKVWKHYTEDLPF